MPATPAGRRAAWRSGGSCPEDVNCSALPPMTGGSVAGAAVSAAARKIQARVYHSESMLVRHMLANPWKKVPLIHCQFEEMTVHRLASET